jgi:hypothetical protein
MGSVREIGELRLVSEPQERNRPVKSAFPAAALVLLVGITGGYYMYNHGQPGVRISVDTL